MHNIVLDSYAVIAFFRKEKAGTKVKRILNQAAMNSRILYMSYINVAEFYYKNTRIGGKTLAEKTLSQLKELPITLVSATNERVLQAAEVKAKYPIALGDCFAIATALEFEASILSGDPELKLVEDIVKIDWLVK